MVFCFKIYQATKLTLADTAYTEAKTKIDPLKVG